MYSLTLPYPPSLNHYLRHTARGVYQTPEAAAYKEQAALVARLAGIDEPISGAVVLVVDVYRPQKRGDLDNSLKVLLDSMNGVLWHDDSQIVEIHAARFDADKETARVEVVAYSKSERGQNT